jgi:hypothetical protein
MADEYLYNQLIKLGDMMGDGLHHEPDGKWISKEYEKISRLLFPEMYVQKNKSIRNGINKLMAEFLADKKCPCGGSLKQTRLGSYKCNCDQCGTKYKVGVPAKQ